MRTLKAINDRVIVAPVQRRDHVPVQTTTGESVKLWMGREKGEPLGVVLSVGPEYPKGGHALRDAARRVLAICEDAPLSSDAFDLCVSPLAQALNARDIEPGDIVVYRRSDTVTETGGIEKWDGQFDVEVLAPSEVWGIVETGGDGAEYMTRGDDSEARTAAGIVRAFGG